jgi:hypothetical protein
MRPVVFIGSSKEGLPVAEAIQNALSEEAEPVLWKTLFEPGDLTIEALEQKSFEFDFAVFILSSDDVLESRGSRGPAPRDNLLLEYGLFVGRLGRDRVFYAFRSGDRPKLPSDLAGTTGVEYAGSGAFGLDTAVVNASKQIRMRIAKLGERSRLPLPPVIRLDFSYLPEVAPTERRWVVDRDIPSDPVPVVGVNDDPRFGRCLSMTAPGSGYMHLDLPYPVPARDVQFLCVGYDWAVYAAVHAWKPGHGGIERAFLRAAGWENRFSRYSDNEWFVMHRSTLIERGWQSIQMSIPELMRATFETEGWRYKDLWGLRLRGRGIFGSVAIYT